MTSERRWKVGVCAASGLAAVGLLAAAAAGTDYDEYKVKAAFLLNFARLVEWPQAAQPGPNEPLVVSIHGKRQAAEEVAAALEGTKVGAHPIHVRTLSRPSEIGGSHIVFVALDDPDAAAAWAAAAGDRAILTVGEAEGFTRRGGVVNFFVEERKLRFEINQAAAERGGLRISSRLLRLARLAPEAR